MPYKFNLVVGEKVILRKFSKAHINETYLNWLNDCDVVKYSNQRFKDHTKDSCLQYYFSFQNTNNLFLSIETKDSNIFIGTMTAYISENHKTVDIGILIGDKSSWYSGYGKDAWSALINWFSQHTDIRKITAGTLSINKPMIKLMDYSGMKLEATRYKQEIVNSEEIDILYYAKFLNG